MRLTRLRRDIASGALIGPRGSQLKGATDKTPASQKKRQKRPRTLDTEVDEIGPTRSYNDNTAAEDDLKGLYGRNHTKQTLTDDELAKHHTPILNRQKKKIPQRSRKTNKR